MVRGGGGRLRQIGRQPRPLILSRSRENFGFTSNTSGIVPCRSLNLGLPYSIRSEHPVERLLRSRYVPDNFHHSHKLFSVLLGVFNMLPLILHQSEVFNTPMLIVHCSKIFYMPLLIIHRSTTLCYIAEVASVQLISIQGIHSTTFMVACYCKGRAPLPRNLCHISTSQ